MVNYPKENTEWHVFNDLVEETFTSITDAITCAQKHCVETRKQVYIYKLDRVICLDQPATFKTLYKSE